MNETNRCTICEIAELETSRWQVIKKIEKLVVRVLCLSA